MVMNHLKSALMVILTNLGSSLMGMVLIEDAANSLIVAAVNIF